MAFVDKYMRIKGSLLGIDIGYNSIKIVSLAKKGDANFLKSYNIATIPPKSLQQKQNDSQKIAEAIKTALNTARPKIYEKLAVSGLPESKVFTKIIQVPLMTDQELETAVPSEAARHIPIPPGEIYLDWQNLGQNEKKALDILIVAAPKYLVDNHIQVFKIVGLELIALETKPIAAARAIIKKNDVQTILILDIGAEATSISIVDFGSIKFTYTIPHGGNTLTKSISDSLKIPLDKAEKLKRESGFRTDDHPETIKAMELVMNDILEEVNNAIKFYESRTKPARKILEVRTCGGAALTPEIASYVAEATGIKTNIANPLINISGINWKKIAKEEIFRLTTAVGLALRERY